MSLGLYNGIITNNGQGLSNGLISGIGSGLQTNIMNTGIPRGNLIHYMDISNRYCFPGGTPTVAKDLAQLPTLNVTVSGGPTLDLEAGGCLNFNGSARWLTTPISTLGSSTSNYTWGGWYKIRQIDGVTSSILLSRGKDTPSFGWSLYIGADVNGFFTIASVTLSPSPVGIGYTTTVQAAPNTWYNLVGTYQNGVGLSVYLNGNFISFFSNTGTNLRSSSNGWTWVAPGETPGTFLNGKIAITYAYQRLLSPSEITQLYNAHRKRFYKN